MNCDASNYVIINRTQIELEIATQNVSFRRKVIVGNNAKHGHVLKPHFATTHTMVSILRTNSGFIPYLIQIRKRGQTQVTFPKVRTTFSIISMYGMSDIPYIEISQNAAKVVIINRTQIELEIATQNVSFRRKVIVGNNAKHGHVLKPHFATTHTMVSILCTNSGFIPYLIQIRRRGHTQVTFPKARTTVSIISMYGMSDRP